MCANAAAALAEPARTAGALSAAAARTQRQSRCRWFAARAPYAAGVSEAIVAMAVERTAMLLWLTACSQKQTAISLKNWIVMIFLDQRRTIASLGAPSG